MHFFHTNIELNCDFADWLSWVCLWLQSASEWVQIMTCRKIVHVYQITSSEEMINVLSSGQFRTGISSSVLSKYLAFSLQRGTNIQCGQLFFPPLPVPHFAIFIYKIQKVVFDSIRCFAQFSKKKFLSIGRNKIILLRFLFLRINTSQEKSNKCTIHCLTCQQNDLIFSIKVVHPPQWHFTSEKLTYRI